MQTTKQDKVVISEPVTASNQKNTPACLSSI